MVVEILCGVKRNSDCNGQRDRVERIVLRLLEMTERGHAQKKKKILILLCFNV